MAGPHSPGHCVEEVKDIHNNAVAMQEYARRAKDSEMIDHATDIRLHAERRAGETASRYEGNRRTGSGREGGRIESCGLLPSTLANLGVTKTESSRWQKLAAMSDKDFEARAEKTKKQAVASIEATAAERTTESGTSYSELLMEMAECGERQPGQEARPGPILALSVAARSLLRRRSMPGLPYGGQHSATRPRPGFEDTSAFGLPYPRSRSSPLRRVALPAERSRHS